MEINLERLVLASLSTTRPKATFHHEMTNDSQGYISDIPNQISDCYLILTLLAER